MIVPGQPAPALRVGLVAYRHRGDEYMVKRVDLTSNMDSVYKQLTSFEASSGGDGPKQVIRGLDEAVEERG